MFLQRPGPYCFGTYLHQTLIVAFGPTMLPPPAEGGQPDFIVEPESQISYGQSPHEVRLQRVTPCLGCLNIDGTVAGPNGSSFQDRSNSSRNWRVL
jgi:hypothetical protein